MENNIVLRLNQAKSLNEVGKILFNVKYYNGRIKEKIVNECNKLGINIIETVKTNNIKPKRYCLTCGKELKQEQNKFCSSSCSAKYNNKHREVHISKESKERMCAHLKNKLTYVDKFIEEKSIGKNNNIYCFAPNDAYIIYNKKNRKRKIYYKRQCICGKIFYSTNKIATHCSPKCKGADVKLKEILRNKMLEKVKNGTHKGWVTRDNLPFTEKVWMDILSKKNIEFKHDFPFKSYLLDFFIEKNGIKIDLEIDGSQHQRRKENDKLRDSILSENNFIVYRIKWNEIKTDKGKEKLNQEIKKFIDFYNKF